MCMKVFKESLNLFLILTIMVFMMVFFHALNSLKLWISFFVIIFYSFLGCVLIYHKVQKKILLFIPSFILSLGIICLFGLIFLYPNRFDEMYLGLIIFISLQFLIYTILLCWAYFIRKKYMVNHFNRVLSVSLGFLMVFMFLEWTKYFQIRDKLILCLLIFLAGILFLYVIQFISNTRNRSILVWGQNILFVGLYFVTNPSHTTQFLAILSVWIMIICLFFNFHMFAKSNNREINQRKMI